jgi:B-block binding subunit of TFIIIC
MKVITITEIPIAVLCDVEDVLDDAKVSYRVEDVDPTRNAIGGFRRGDPTTSRLAALQAFPRTGNQRHKALLAIAAAGTRGATAYELEQATGINYRSLTPRIGELKAGGWVAAKGARLGNMGAQQEVLVATQRTLDWLSSS